jgi:protein gp37
MGDKTAISWTSKTWNPWRGCTRVSPGCAHCYALARMDKLGFDPYTVTRTKTWADPLRWQVEAEAAGIQERVFTCSWSDWFHPDADAWRAEAWDIVRRCPNLIFQILTKRPGLIGWPEDPRLLDSQKYGRWTRLPADWGLGYPNVWLGVSIESRQFLWRMEFLRRIPARIRFISAEPLLGPLVLTKQPEALTTGTPSLAREEAEKLFPEDEAEQMEYVERESLSFYENSLPFKQLDLAGFHWVIVGGESGPGFRPMDHAWAREIRDQCQREHVAFFFKQSAAIRTEMGTQLDGREWKEYPK